MMSKLNRSEFKELLLEWNKNFINERNIKDFAGVTGITDQQIKFVKSVPVGLNLYVVGDYYVDKKNRLPMSYVLIESMKNSSSVFKEIHDALILEKSGINEMIDVLEFLLGESTYSYYDRNDELIQDKEVKEKSKHNIGKMKKDLNSLNSDTHGIMLYFPRMDSFRDQAADGSIKNIGNVSDPAVWKNSLSWELKHDVFHYFESLLREVKSENYKFIHSTFMRNKNIHKIIKSFKVPDQELKSKDTSIQFGTSLQDADNFATVVPYIRSFENNELNKKEFVRKCITIADSKGIDLSKDEKRFLSVFFEKSHECYEEVESILKDKIVIQKAH